MEEWTNCVEAIVQEVQEAEKLTGNNSFEQESLSITVGCGDFITLACC